MPDYLHHPDDETLRLLTSALTESGQAISIYDADDKLRYANRTYCDLFLEGFEGPYTFTEILRHGAGTGRGVRIDDNVDALIAKTLPRRRSMASKSFETDFVDGRWFWMDHTVLPNGWLLTVGADITALKRNEKTLRQAHDEALLAARTDPLTGLPNRRHILELLDQELAESRAGNRSLCLAVIDIDRFKALNDVYGHHAGDAALRHFADVCRERLPSEGILGRIGGEEFLLLLPGIRPSKAVHMIDILRHDFPWFRVESVTQSLSFTFSAGITEALPHDDRSSMQYRADRALYAAKREGRNCTRLGFEVETFPRPERAGP